jgi:hypothetical protein
MLTSLHFLEDLTYTSRNIDIKVGRETRVNERFKYWTRHYRSQHLRQLFPGNIVLVPAYKKVERLIHLELEDLAQHLAYLERDYPLTGHCPSPRAKAPKPPCAEAGCPQFYRYFQ